MLVSLSHFWYFQIARNDADSCDRTHRWLRPATATTAPIMAVAS
jgi:hypothetical protein